MIVILASAWDAPARSLADAWPDAVLMTPADLSRSGWRHDPLHPRDDVAVPGGVRIASRDIRGVVTRLARVDGVDLPHVVEDDRPYVAAEMTAFLLSWLSSLACPVLNRPNAMSLAGPAWGSDRWRRAAVRAGAGGAPDRPAETVVTVIGEECIGDASLAPIARAIAAEAGATLLETAFARENDTWALVHASPWVNAADATVRHALRRMLVTP